jgi:hypothetical protein
LAPLLYLHVHTAVSACLCAPAALTAMEAFQHSSNNNYNNRIQYRAGRLGQVDARRQAYRDCSVDSIIEDVVVADAAVDFQALGVQC